MLAIKNNLMAENAARNLGRSYDTLATSVERLASGLRINSAKDDAAGLAVRELIRADVAQLRQGVRNARDAISMLQTAEGALGTVNEILVRMKELAEQAATASYSSEQRQIMDSEFSQLAAEIDRIAGNTTFNDLNLLNASTSYNIHVGPGATIAVSGGDMTAGGLGVGGVKESVTPEKWVGSDTADFIKEADTADSGLKFEFEAQDAFTVTISQNTTLNVTEFAAAVNSASRGTTEAYDAAKVVYDAESGAYSVKITAAVNGDKTITVTEVVGGDLQWGDGTVVSATPNDDFINVMGTGTAISIATVSGAETALTTITTAIETKDTTRAKLGYLMNRLEAATAVIDVQAENLLAAESRISDVDVATEMAKLTRTQVLAQAGVAMLAQANTMPQMALTLLRG